MKKKKTDKAKTEIACIERSATPAKIEDNQIKTVAKTLSVEEKKIKLAEFNKRQDELSKEFKELHEILNDGDDPPLNENEKAMIQRWSQLRKQNENPYFYGVASKYIGERFDLACAGVFEATGASDLSFGLEVLGNCAVASCLGSVKLEKIYNAIANTMNEFKPADPIEGMLISRLVALHFQGIHYLACAANNESTTEQRDTNINRSTKLSRLYNETLESLMRYRRQGEQKVTVTHQHVNINDNGRAIVGGVFEGGGRQQKICEVTT